MSENNDTSIEANCLRGGFMLKASRLGGAVLRPAVLGPSVLGHALVLTNNSSTSLAGSEKTEEVKASGEVIVNNPFLREQKEEDDAASSDVVESTEKSEKEDEEIDERPDPLTMLRTNGIERANIFSAAKTSLPRVNTSGFVFGQNVHERVVGENVSTESNAAAGVPEASSSQLLFSSVIQKAATAKSTENSHSKEAEAKSLTDVAREYEESRAQKRKYEEVETFTGEENEINIVDVSCKLFAFLNSNWEERGRGSLRLNDAKDARYCSRVVFRTSGNLRLVLNTKVWAAMVAERASQKSLRLTAIDNTGTVKIFLAMGRPADIALLHKALSERISKRKQTHPDECAAPDNGEQAKNGVEAKSSNDCGSNSQPESTTHDDDGEDIDDDDDDAVDDDGDRNVVEACAAQAADSDSDEPSPKKLVLVVPDSSGQVVHEKIGDAEADVETDAAQN